MKKSEHAKTPEREDGVDMISKLPDDVLLLILSRLQGTEEVNRTSILSTRWKYVWTSVPSVDIDYNRGPDLLEELDSIGFKEFVDWVLLNKPMDLDSFRIWCGNYYSMSTIRQWIYAAVMRNVKLLDLMFRPIDESEDIELPHCLVTCGSLEVLKLHLLGCPLRLPNITGFQALRVLKLMEVNLFDEYGVVEYVLESCPLLEDLSLIDCRADALIISCSKLKNLRIDTRQLASDEEATSSNLDLDWEMCIALEVSCPKLEFMELIGYVATEFHFESLYSLKRVVIHAEKLFQMEVPPLDFFDKISHVESLSISVYCIGQCFDSDPRVDDPISLPNLKNLELTVDGPNMHELVPFLVCLPDLESLHLIIPKYVYGLDKWHEDYGITISVLTRHLKKVEFLEFDEEKPRLDVARALLEHGSLLEEMVQLG